MKELWNDPEFFAWNLQRESLWINVLEAMSDEEWQLMCQTLPETFQF